MPHPKDAKNQLDFQMQSFMLNLSKKINIQEAYQTLKIIGEAISNYIISFRFPDTKIKWIT